MCNGYVLVDYDKNIPDVADDGGTLNDNTYGLWDLKSSFTIEAIVTPYDVNGNSSGTIKTSTRTMPYSTSSNNQSHSYMTHTARLDHEMCIFYSTNVQLYLVNDAANAANKPAEYKIKLIITANGTTETLTSAVVIKGETAYSTNPEALYLLTPYHIAATLSVSDGIMSIYLNNSLIATTVHSGKSSTASLPFSMEKSDCYLGVGQYAENKNPITRKQFMGEMHEFAISLNSQSDFPFMHTLLPNFRNTLLYLRFEEVDE